MREEAGLHAQAFVGLVGARLAAISVKGSSRESRDERPHDFSSDRDGDYVE